MMIPISQKPTFPCIRYIEISTTVDNEMLQLVITLSQPGVNYSQSTTSVLKLFVIAIGDRDMRQ